MAYRIIYHAVKKRNHERNVLRCILMTTVFFIAFLWSVSTFWPEGKIILESIVTPYNPEMTRNAVKVFSQELRSGFSLTDAVKNLYLSVIEYGS